MTKKFLVDKLLNALAPYHHQMVWDIRGKYGFKDMSPDDVISTFQFFEESQGQCNKTSCHAWCFNIKAQSCIEGQASSMLRNQVMKKKNMKEGGEIDSDECPSYEDMALFVKKFSSGAFKGRFPKKKVRTCYNCEEIQPLLRWLPL